MTKRKRNTAELENIVGASLFGAVGSMALGAVGGNVAQHGQQGISNATRFLPAAGTFVGAGMLMNAVKNLEPKKRSKSKMYFF